MIGIVGSMDSFGREQVLITWQDLVELIGWTGVKYKELLNSNSLSGIGGMSVIKEQS